MSRHSSDSDSSNYRRRSRRKRRSPSVSSSDSGRHRRNKSLKHNSSHYKKSSSKRYKSRSYKRSRSKSKTTVRHSRSASKERHRRSHSREKYRSHYKSRMHLNCPDKKYHSRSKSSDSKNSTSSSGSSNSSSAGSKKTSLDNKKNYPNDLTLNQDQQLREKLLKAIKAVESVDHQLKQQGVLPECVKSRNDISNLTQCQPQSEALIDINADVFIPKTFHSSKHNKENNFDDLNITSDIHVVLASDIENSLFHKSFFIDPKAKQDWWIKKLYQIRQKAISGEPST